MGRAFSAAWQGRGRVSRSQRCHRDRLASLRVPASVPSVRCHPVAAGAWMLLKPLIFQGHCHTYSLPVTCFHEQITSPIPKPGDSAEMRLRKYAGSAGEALPGCPWPLWFPGQFWWGARRGAAGLGGGHPVGGCELLPLGCSARASGGSAAGRGLGSGACRWKQRYPTINGLRLLQGYILPNQSPCISKLEAVKITSLDM